MLVLLLSRLQSKYDSISINSNLQLMTLKLGTETRLSILRILYLMMITNLSRRLCIWWNNNGSLILMNDLTSTHSQLRLLVGTLALPNKTQGVARLLQWTTTYFLKWSRVLTFLIYRVRWLKTQVTSTCTRGSTKRPAMITVFRASQRILCFVLMPMTVGTNLGASQRLAQQVLRKIITRNFWMPKRLFTE
jgi:hypothetical protein